LIPAGNLSRGFLAVPIKVMEDVKPSGREAGTG